MPKPGKANLLISAQRELGLRGTLHDFVMMAWHVVEPGQQFQDNWHIRAICDHLEAVLRGTTRSLVINVPPGHMKSLLTCVFFPAWAWIRQPGHRFGFASFDSELTSRDARKSLQLMQSEWYQERWADAFQLPRELAVTSYTNSAGGLRFSTSIKGKLTGRHFDTFIVDDPIKPQEVNKKAISEVAEWWHGTAQTRFRDPKTKRRVIIMQRLHEDDLAGIAIKDGFTALRFPMRYETASPDPSDPRTEDGQLLWPERVPEETAAELEKELGSQNAAAQLQQRPVPAGGLVFKAEWLREWVKPGASTVPGTKHWTSLPDRFDLEIQSWDLAFKGTNTSDFVVGQVWGRRKGEFFLLWQVKGRWDFPATIAQIRLLSSSWPKTITKLVEDKANGPAVISSLEKEIAGLLAVNPEGGKEARANAVAPLYEAGNVYYPSSDVAPWVAEHRDNLLLFPVAKYDDEVDAATQALLYLYSRKTFLAEAMAKVRAKMDAGEGIF